jgi:hypothetical protein
MNDFPEKTDDDPGNCVMPPTPPLSSRGVTKRSEFAPSAP